MNMEIYTPQIIFISTFFVSFLVIEFLLLFLLNRFEKNHWEFFVDVVIKEEWEHHNMLKWIVGVTGIGMVAYLYLFTSLSGRIIALTTEVKWLAIILLISIIIIYFIGKKKMAKLAIERKIYGGLYFLVSIALFALIITMADQSYLSYKAYVNANISTVIIDNYERLSESENQFRLITKFSKKAYADECERVDYTKKSSDEFLHFVYLKTDPSLAIGSLPENDLNALKGRLCKEGEDALLLTDDGKWYWVIKDSKN